MAYNNQRTNNQRPTNQRPTNQTAATQNFTDLSGKEMRIFVNVFNNGLGISTSLSHKTQDGDFDNMCINVTFAKCDPPTAEGLRTIKINRGFWSCYYSKKHETMLPQVVVLDYEET